MKKLFQHTKRPYEKWEGYDQDDLYDWDAADGDGESFDGAEEEYYAEGEDFAYAEELEEDSYVEGEEPVYAEGTEEEYYAEGEEPVYAEELEELEEDSYVEGEDSVYAEDTEEYYGDEEYGEEGYYADDDDYAEEETRSAAFGGGKRPEDRKNVFVMLWEKFLAMGTMDRVITVTGVAVLILALVTGSVYLSTRAAAASQVSALANVGEQLDGITVIGEKGLLAVADAEMARLAAAEIVEEEEEQKEYDEADYSSAVTVKLNMTSVLKDLKIKFTNGKTGKLVANVPFSVTVTGPDGKSETWSDDDMDGIIYKKNITPGTYSVLVNELTGEKYKDYTIPSGAQKVEVKKDISYEKIDVSDEVKTEAEIDVSREDTKVNDTVVESALQDTVAWVESTAVTENYTEVARSTVPDPTTLVMSKSFLRLANTTATGAGTVSGSDTDQNQAFTATISPASVTTGIGGTVTAQITATNYTVGRTLKYSVVSDKTDIATAAVDTAGKITVTGKAAGTATVTATVDYAAGESRPVTVKLAVTVLAQPAVTLDKTTATVFRTSTATITATVANATTDAAVTAVSSDTQVATVTVSGRTVTVTGVAEGDAVITVTYTENGQQTQAVCAVKVKTHPKDNRTDRLKDSQGRQLYVLENEQYREAFYADYYTGAKLFIKGDTKYTGWQTIDGNVYFFTASGDKVTGEQVIQGAKYNFASDGSLVTGSGTMGIDVSKWNGTIDWNAVKNSGISYVIIRCGYRGSSQGMLIEDPKFNANIKGATDAGLKVGVYFFTQATDEIEAVEEASYVLGKIRNYKISYPVFLDVESSGGRGDKIDKATRTAVCKAFCETIQRNGYTAGIYANKTWLTTKLDANALSAYKIWLAQYAAAPTYTGRYDLWQYKSTGRVSGISGNVDLNLSYLGY